MLIFMDTVLISFYTAIVIHLFILKIKTPPVSKIVLLAVLAAVLHIICLYLHVYEGALFLTVLFKAGTLFSVLINFLAILIIIDFSIAGKGKGILTLLLTFCVVPVVFIIIFMDSWARFTENGKWQSLELVNNFAALIYIIYATLTLLFYVFLNILWYIREKNRRNKNPSRHRIPP